VKVLTKLVCVLYSTGIVDLPFELISKAVEGKSNTVRTYP